MSRLIHAKQCPHCGDPLPQPVPRSCPRCAGSLQQRYLRWGCLSSAPKLLVLALGLWWLAR
jgi:hypothetical protein